jgi:hypothetical protein
LILLRDWPNAAAARYLNGACPPARSGRLAARVSAQALRIESCPDSMCCSVQTRAVALPTLALPFSHYKERVMNKLMSTVAIGLFAVTLQVPGFAADPVKADADAHKEMAKGDYKATKEKADAREKASKEECSKLSGADEHACKERAKAHAKTTKAEAKANYEHAKDESKSMK